MSPSARTSSTNGPDILGVAEVAAYLGVTKQRVSELAKQPTFPTPVKLASGPVWDGNEIRAFRRIWRRRPGATSAPAPNHPDSPPVLGQAALTRPEQIPALTSLELDTYRALRREGQDLADWYWEALRLLEDEISLDPIGLAAHEIREVIKHLHERTATPGDGTARKAEDALKLLRSKWAAVGDVLLATTEQDWQGHVPDELADFLASAQEVLAPTALPPTVDLIARFLKVKSEKRTKLPLPAAAGRAKIRRWTDARTFFNGIGHHGKGASPAEVRERISVLSELILDELRPRTVRDLSQINQLIVRVESGQEIALIPEVLASIKLEAAAVYFFETISSPLWLASLKEGGWFKDPPEPVVEGETVGLPFWPPAKYLVEVAEREPAAVIEIILSLKEHGNQRIHEQLISASLRMPAKVARRIVPKAVKWLESPYLLMLVPRRIAELCAKLAAEGGSSEALQLAQALLALNPGIPAPHGRQPGDSYYIWPDPRPRFEMWEYTEILRTQIPLLAEHVGLPVFQLLLDTLGKAISLERPDVRPPDDYSYIWRRAIEDHRDNLPGQVKAELVDAVRDVGNQLITADVTLATPILDLLVAFPWHVGSRIMLHLTRLHASTVPARVTGALTDPALFEAMGVRHEYVLLAREQFGHLAAVDRWRVFQMIAEGPNEDNIREFYRRNQFDVPEAEFVRGSVARWKRDRLAPIQAFLTTRWQREYASLVSEFGPAIHDDFMIGATIFSGPISPINDDELKRMTPSELAAYARDWEPASDIRGPSPDGLGRSISSLVAKRPQVFATDALAFANISSTYVAALMTGWHNALKGSRYFEWSGPLDLAQQMLESYSAPTEQTASELPGALDSESHRWTKSELLRLVAQGMDDGPGRIPSEFGDQVWRIIAELAEDPEPTPSDEAEHLQSHGPATLAINTVRPLAVDAAIRFILWEAKNRAVGGDAFANHPHWLKDIPEVASLLVRHLDPDTDTSLAVRAAYGRQLPWLIAEDEEWVRQHLDQILPTEPGADALRSATWDAYLTYCAVYSRQFEVLRSHYVSAVRKLDPLNDAEATSQNVETSLVTHILTEHIRGNVALGGADQLLETLYNRASVRLRAYGISMTGRSLGSGGEMPAEVAAAFRRFASWRIDAVRRSSDQEAKAELAPWSWWFASGSLDPDWSLGRLIEVLRLGVELEHAYQVIERLATLAPDRPGPCIEALGLLVESTEEPWAFMAAKEQMSAILSTGLSADDPSIREEAERVRDLLAARGERDLPGTERLRLS
jgi:predicted DNA-binding transcriptional regulator AlpA